MDLDLITNSSSIKENINSLLSGKIVWIVLGYMGNQTITVVEVGDDSLEDMFEEFHGSRIMYGFASVTDPNTKLKKNVFIYWQGSGASQVMKTKSVQHSNVIRELCKPIHVTITARDEQDLDIKDIMLKVAAASGSNYSFHSENKQIFESQPSVKSEGNTANAARQERHKELASLSNIKKEVPPPIQKEINNSTKSDISKHIKPTLANKATFQKGTNYVKTNVEKEVRSINTNQKITFESPATVKSENNTPDRAKEERKKELSQLLNRTFDDEPFQQVGTNYIKINPLADIQRLRRESQSHDTEILMESRVSHVSKVDPKEEITRLKRAGSNASETDINFSPITSYKKIDPMSEIQELRRASKTIEFDQCVSPSSTYKKINPAEEIKNLKSQSSCTPKETTPISTNYKKINPTEEIMAAKTTYKNSTEISEDNKPTYPVNTANNEAKSARMTFENIHKSKASEPQGHISHEDKPPSVSDTQNFKTKVERKVEVKSENQSITFDNSSFDEKNHNFNNNKAVPVDQSNQEKVDNISGIKEKIPSGKRNLIEVDPASLVSREKATKLSNSAVAIYEYQANDADEISFEVGELITEIDHIDEGWWLGYNAAGMKGMFPSNYVDVSKIVAHAITPILDDRNSDVQPERKLSEDISNTGNLSDTFLTVVAEYPYDAQDKDELSFQKGDMIYNVTKIDEGWWEGEMENGTKGMFPSNYVVII